MKTLLSFSLFLVLVVLQLYVPASMIMGQEKSLKHGALYKFRCAPVDPADPFRGRYVALSILENSVSNWTGGHLSTDQRVYATVGTGEDGFATLEEISIKPPKVGDYIKAQVLHTIVDSSTVRLRLPIERFYMNEHQAPKAEEAYRRLSAEEENNVFVTVRLHAGKAVIEDLFIDDTPIGEYVRSGVGEG